MRPTGLYGESHVVLQMASPAQAGLFKKLGAVGVAVAGVETAGATVDAIAVVGSAAYISSVMDLKSNLATHRFVGPPGECRL
jgi:hypothetical protein